MQPLIQGYESSSVGRLRSSPAPEGRCNRQERRRSPHSPPGCDPHRPRRAGATRDVRRCRRDRHLVAILTGPGGPVQRDARVAVLRLVEVAILTGPGGPVQLPGGAPTRAVPTPSCDPHRPRRASATAEVDEVTDQEAAVAILTGPGGPVQRRRRPNPGPDGLVLRSSPAPEGRCNPTGPPASRARGRVAILTGPGGPVQQPTSGGSSPPPRPVAILTGPGGPVQHVITLAWIIAILGCDPHRPRRAGATRGRSPRCSDGRSCDPHRPRRAGATPEDARAPGRRGVVAILTGPGGPVQPCRGRSRSPPPGCCDPHRPRRAGATGDARQQRVRRGPVAILTGPGGPVQPGGPRRGQNVGPVAILTGPGGPVQRCASSGFPGYALHEARRNQAKQSTRPGIGWERSGVSRDASDSQAGS